MKCPKCGYLGFDRVDRCRNCGYEFSLSSGPEAPELPLRSSSEAAPRALDELSLLEPSTGAESGSATGDGDSTSVDLPLFGSQLEDDAPLITRAAPPRPPLAVRRATPQVGRLTTVTGRAPALDFERSDRPPAPAIAETGTTGASQSTGASEDASIVARGVAVLADLLILAGIDAAVVYLTLQICGITLAEFAIVPKAPLIAFLVVQNGGYLVAFTATGRTLGKLAAGIRVISAEPDAPIDLGRALMRELLWAVLAIPAGLGLLTVLGRDRRGLHDRFAGTRVVRA
jgi:uncharacterized RDD family membrane protein YckC